MGLTGEVLGVDLVEGHEAEYAGYADAVRVRAISAGRGSRG